MGIFIFNPIMGRTTAPMQLRVILSIVLTFVFVGAMGDTIGYIPQSMLEFGVVLAKEAMIGFIFGFIVTLFLNILIYAGNLIDFQMSFAMANIFDPSTGVTMPITANIYYYMFFFYFFLAGGHLNTINLFYLSYQIVPIGFEFTTQWRDVAYVIPMFFADVMTLAVKMAMPLVVSQTILQIAVGVIMKAVPSIQIFVINIQMRVFMGMFLLVAITPVMSTYVQMLMDLMFENMFGILYALGGFD
jgi:flagellar biosynthetic protein FliR